MTQDQDYEVTGDVINQALANVHTIVVGKITAVHDTTIDVKPSMARVVDGQIIELPVFANVPPVFLSGGSSHLKMPLTVGDSCLLLISERCFDTWYIGQDGAAPLEARMHDYSDGFALVGIKMLAEALLIPLVIELIGDMFAEGNHEHLGDLLRTGLTTLIGGVEHTGDTNHTGTYNLIGPLNITGGAAMTGDGDANFASYKTGDAVGQTGVFTSADGKTITVTNGLVTGIA